MAHLSSRRNLSLGAAALVLGLAVSAPPAHAERSFDLRPTLAAPEAPAPSGAHARALAAWRAAVADLRVTIDPTTGATRTLSNAVGFLTGPRAGADVESIALGFAQDELALLGLEAADLAGAELTDRVDSSTSGVAHLYFGQRHAGIPVWNGLLQINVGPGGRILSLNSSFVPGLERAVNALRPDLDAAAAIAAAVADAERAAGTAAAAVSAPELRYLPIRPAEVRLVWNLRVETAGSLHYWDVNVDALDGRVWTRFDWIDDALLGGPQYTVYPVPVEAPSFTTPAPPADGRVLVNDPADTTASPFGWHDTNGVAGNEFTIHRGNNVHAWEDGDGNEIPPAVEPDCTAAIDCTFPIDLTLDPDFYESAAVTNLFFWNNVIHDVAFLYGFDSPGGNFQVNTYGQGGVGGDDVRALAQSGAGVNNANFLTLPDGQRPRMRMYLWTTANPRLDGDLDDGVVVHEYGHGISNRLVGGPANTSCLGNAERPSEGLSDWWSLFYTFRATNDSVRGIGTYVLNQPITGVGIRSQRYDKDPEPNTNSWTYASVQGSVIPHGVGEKWAQAYWYVQGRLEDAHGFDPDIYAYTGTGADAGNIRAMYYIIEGLKNTACSPGFVDTRDGILTAVASSYGGEDLCTVWGAFAEFGLGFSASQGSSASINDQVPAFDLPPACAFVTPPADAQICAGDDFVDTVDVGAGFTSAVTMSTSGVPAPASSSFSPNPVPTPLPASTTLTISNTAGVSPGVYTIDVIGDDGGGPQAESFDLEILGGPSAPTLTSPPNGATNISLTPTLVWQAVAGATSYFVEVDDDPGFGSPEFTGTTAATSIQASGLEAITTYHWRVTATDACGPGTPAAAFSFTTRDTMPFLDGFESGDTSGWSSTTP